MSERQTYVLDANVFIEARRRYYAFDLCPGFWRSLLLHHEQGNLLSIDRVADELTGYKDELSEWVSNEVPAECFASSREADVARSYRELIAWVYQQEQFLPRAKEEYADSADGWLLAYGGCKLNRVSDHS